MLSDGIIPKDVTGPYGTGKVPVYLGRRRWCRRWAKGCGYPGSISESPEWGLSMPEGVGGVKRGSRWRGGVEGGPAPLPEAVKFESDPHFTVNCPDTAARIPASRRPETR